MNTLFNQLSETEREAVALLCGFQDCAGFRNTLYDMPEVEGNLGKVAEAVLKFRMKNLKRVMKAK
jgi:hypothetical protein